MKYTVDVFTPSSVYVRDAFGRGHPEDTFTAIGPDELAHVIQNCIKESAGICKIEVWVGDPPIVDNPPGKFKSLGLEEKDTLQVMRLKAALAATTLPAVASLNDIFLLASQSTQECFLFMNARNYAYLRQHHADQLDLETQGHQLKQGIMAVWRKRITIVCDKDIPFGICVWINPDGLAGIVARIGFG
jgi:hypothetical protein